MELSLRNMSLNLCNDLTLRENVIGSLMINYDKETPHKQKKYACMLCQHSQRITTVIIIHPEGIQISKKFFFVIHSMVIEPFNHRTQMS